MTQITEIKFRMQDTERDIIDVLRAQAARRGMTMSVLMRKIALVAGRDPAMLCNFLDDADDIAEFERTATTVQRIRATSVGGVPYQRRWKRPGKFSSNVMNSALGPRAERDSYVPTTDRGVQPSPKETLRNMLADAVAATARLPVGE